MGDLGSGHQEVIRRLHADVVDETLPSDFVVGRQYVMEILDSLVEVAHVMTFRNIIKSHNFFVTMRTSLDRTLKGFVGEGVFVSLLTAASSLLKSFVWQSVRMAYHF